MYQITSYPVSYFTTVIATFKKTLYNKLHCMGWNAFSINCLAARFRTTDLC